MKMTDNTILITGGGSGIGRALAEMFYSQGNTVVITGRNEKKLREMKEIYPGIEYLTLDIDDKLAIEDFKSEVLHRFPSLNVVIHNAGIMQEEVIGKDDVPIAEAIIETNLLGFIRLNSALVPHLVKQKDAVIVSVSSGLAFLPLSLNPTYSASKAAVHSYTQSLRYQLQDRGVQVIELVPPYVRTGLQGERQASDPNAMPVDEFISEVTSIIEAHPEVAEILVERVMFQRTAESSGEYADRLRKMNEMLIAQRTK